MNYCFLKNAFWGSCKGFFFISEPIQAGVYKYIQNDIDFKIFMPNLTYILLNLESHLVFIYTECLMMEYIDTIDIWV